MYNFERVVEEKPNELDESWSGGDGESCGGGDGGNARDETNLLCESRIYVSFFVNVCACVKERGGEREKKHYMYATCFMTFTNF